MSKKSKKSKLKVKKVHLPPNAIVRVVVPKEHTPLVAHDPVKGHVEIVPVPVKKKSNWWTDLFG